MWSSAVVTVVLVRRGSCANNTANMAPCLAEPRHALIFVLLAEQSVANTEVRKPRRSLGTCVQSSPRTPCPRAPWPPCPEWRTLSVCKDSPQELAYPDCLV
jgi:hypothetical protein